MMFRGAFRLFVSFSTALILARRSLLTCPVVIGLLFALLAPRAEGAPVDLRTWEHHGATGSRGQWVVSPDGSCVTQTRNGDDTFFVSPAEIADGTLQAILRVDDCDDDGIGFVMGYSAPISGSTLPNEADLLYLYWLREDSNGGCSVQSVPPPGFYLTWIRGDLRPEGPSWTQLGSFVGPGRGWIGGTNYELSLTYAPDRISLYVEGGTGEYQNGTVVIDVEGCFPRGRIGFANTSQAGASYCAADLNISPPAVDTDGDKFADSCDNCKCVSNPNQQDSDGDAGGDVCDVLPEQPVGLCVLGPIVDPVGPAGQGVLVPQSDVQCLPLPEAPEVCI